MEPRHVYGHYKPGGTCYCDKCLGGFLKEKHLDAAVLGKLTDGKARYEWLRREKLSTQYDKHLEDQTAVLAAWMRDDLHQINPDFLICVYVLEIGNWSCRGMARGFGTPEVPVLNFAEETYYGVGYDPPYIRRQNTAFSDWGASVVPGCAVWDVYFPPTRPAYLAAHCYHLALQGGYWFWPGCDLLSDDRGGARWTYAGRAAAMPDYWLALREANAEIDRRMAGGESYAGPLTGFEPVPWQGAYRESENKWKPGFGVERNQQPVYPIHVVEPCAMRFLVPPRTRSFTLLARAAGGPGKLEILSPAGRSVRAAACPSGENARLEINVAAEDHAGLWTLSITPPPGPQSDLGLQVQGIPVYLSPAGVVPLGPQMKRGDLLTCWPPDDGQGRVAAEASGPPPYNGTVHGAAWVRDESGPALSFDGRQSFVKVGHSWSMDNLDQFTLAARVPPRKRCN